MSETRLLDWLAIHGDHGGGFATDVTPDVYRLDCDACGVNIQVPRVTPEAQTAEPVGAILDLFGPQPPREWTGYDAWQDYEGYGDLVDDVDPSNSGDVHAHGMAVAEHRLYWKLVDLIGSHPVGERVDEIRERFLSWLRRERPHYTEADLEARVDAILHPAPQKGDDER